MLFAHLADCHIGGWRDASMSMASAQAFVKAVDMCIARAVDFVLISGDLFNTALPSVDSLKDTVQKLKELSDNHIPVYVVAGSHDYSPSGKTMLDVLETAGLFVNVARPGFTLDKKTGAKITGLFGRKGALEVEDYAALDRQALELEGGFKIFMLHSAVESMGSGCVGDSALPLSALPNNFNYYAAGHVHSVISQDFGSGVIAFPGPLFPNNFGEIEKLQNGGFYFVEENNGRVALEWQPVVVHNVHSIVFDCSDKIPEQVERELLDEIKAHEFNNTLVTLRLFGVLKSGKPSDINFKRVVDELKLRSAHFVMKNTAALKGEEYESIQVEHSSVEEIESKLISQSRKLGLVEEDALARSMMSALDVEKQDGENSATFERRVREQASKLLGV